MGTGLYSFFKYDEQTVPLVCEYPFVRLCVDICYLFVFCLRNNKFEMEFGQRNETKLNVFVFSQMFSDYL